jgi:hypothetical protein
MNAGRIKILLSIGFGEEDTKYQLLYWWKIQFNSRD